MLEHTSLLSAGIIFMRKQAVGTATIPAPGAGRAHSPVSPPALTCKAWSEDRGRAPNPKQGDNVRTQGAAIGDLNDRASLDATVEGVDVVFYIEPAFLPMRMRSARAWSMVPNAPECVGARFFR